MKHLVSNLEGPLLDAAVAKAEGYELDAYGGNRTIRENGGAPSAWKPSTDWLQAGPIIERERVELRCFEDLWIAGMIRAHGAFAYSSASPLVAAMRTFAACKLGDEIDLGSLASHSGQAGDNAIEG